MVETFIFGGGSVATGILGHVLLVLILLVSKDFDN